jgi:sugar phosphate isomerase/epimerase
MLSKKNMSTDARSIGQIRSKKIPIGFQLWAVRAEFAGNVRTTLQQLKEIGYDGVEFWGYSGMANVFENYSAGQLRSLLNNLGLKCCGIHIELPALAGENLQRTIENSLLLGTEFITLAGAKEKMTGENEICDLAALLNNAAARCRQHRLTVGYHAHPFDFAKVDGRFAWEILFERLGMDLNMQMDVGNCLSGAGDPIAMLEKFPNRTRTIHLKEHKDKTFGSTLYQKVFQMCETNSVTEWYIVEMGGLLGHGFKAATQGIKKLRDLGK